MANFEYDPVATSNWTIGTVTPEHTNLTSFYRGLSGLTEGWVLEMNDLPLQPGEYTFTRIKHIISLDGTGDCDAANLVIWNKSGTVYTQVLNVDVNNSRLASTEGTTRFFDSNDDTTDFGAGKALTVNSGDDLFWSLALRKPVGGGSGRPGLKLLNAGEGPGNINLFFITPSTSALPTVIDSSVTTPAATTDTYAAGCVFFKTNARKITSISTFYSGSAKDIIIPRPDAHDSGWIMLKGTDVADTQDVTVKLQETAAGAESNLGHLAMDMNIVRNLDFGTNAAPVSQALGGQVGETFDLGIAVRESSVTHDLFYQNTQVGQGDEGTGDFQTISHWAKANAAHTTAITDGYGFGSPTMLAVTGAGTIATLEVGWEPMVILGDSQAGNSGSNLLRVGRLAEDMPHIPMTWHAAISGNSLDGTIATLHTAAKLRFKHGTPGKGDLVDMWGAVFYIAGIGINDISSNITNPGTDAEVTAIINTLDTAIASILTDIYANNGHAILLGLPPWGAGSVKEQEAIPLWNAKITTNAFVNNSAIFNPFPMVSEDLVAFLDNAGAGPHYIVSDGAAPVRAALVKEMLFVPGNRGAISSPPPELVRARQARSRR